MGKLVAAKQYLSHFELQKILDIQRKEREGEWREGERRVREARTRDDGREMRGRWGRGAE